MKNEEKKSPTCFVIMPISDVQGYELGHFARVYEHILKPAILAAGYNPIRADDAIKTDYIVVGIIQKIVESEMVICDFSAKNANVMYELGIRHAFNKPVTLIKDRKTEKVFDIQGLRYTEYDESLRIDSVQKDISKITAAILETGKAGQESLNSVVQLAGIRAAEVPAGQTVSPDTQLILSSINILERRIESIESTNSYEKYFVTDEDSVVFNDNSNAIIGDEIFDSKANLIGKLTGIRPSEDKIYVLQKSGKTLTFSALSRNSRELSSIPF